MFEKKKHLPRYLDSLRLSSSISGTSKLGDCVCPHLISFPLVSVPTIFFLQKKNSSDIQEKTPTEVLGQFEVLQKRHQVHLLQVELGRREGQLTSQHFAKI